MFADSEEILKSKSFHHRTFDERMTVAILVLKYSFCGGRRHFWMGLEVFKSFSAFHPTYIQHTFIERGYGALKIIILMYC
jgi:hypothetical protein